MDQVEQHIAPCNFCGCEMNITSLEPYTNVVCPDCGEHTRVKRQLGHYLLTKRYAAGGMSMVFAAMDTTLEREVAIKVLNESYSHDEVRMEEFQKEAQITAALSHPHIVRVFTVGRAYGAYYIAMEMVSGGNLEQRIGKEGSVKEEELLPIAAEMIAALRAAKQADLIHRDIKPGNILFDASGHVKIVDFGLALVTQGGKAKADEIWATPYYVPPEALEGAEEDFRSDMYALGATLYHALSGKPPIPDVEPKPIVMRKAKENVLSLAKVAPWLKPETCYLVDKAMALHPKDRFASYQEMEEAWESARLAVQGVGGGEQVHSQNRVRHRGVKKKGMLSFIIIGAVALGLLGYAATIFLNKNGSAEAEDVANGSVTQDVSSQTNNLSGEGQDYSPEAAAKIGQMFRRSHALLKDRKYDEAKDIFVDLMHDPKVKEPAASWAGVEAVIATWLGGNSGDASNSINSLKKHINQKEVSSSTEIGALVSQLSGPAVIRDPELSGGAMDVVYLMAVALKNWEIGAWDDAVPIFQRVEEMDIAPSSPLHVYQLLSNRYLADYNILKPYIDQPTPKTVPEGQLRTEKLRGLLKNLQTRGRARFHIRIWQIRALHQVRQLREKEALAGIEQNKAPAYSKVVPEFRKLLDQAKYAEASDLLQDVTVEKDEETQREAWIYLADSASTFLDGLEEVIPDRGVTMEISGVDGKVYTRILSAKSGGLSLQGNEGKVFLPWTQIAPDSVLIIHQKAFKQTLETLEGQLRTEQAICYAHLVGENEKANRAAQKLAEVSENFGKRWKKTMEVLDGQ